MLRNGQEVTLVVKDLIYILIIYLNQQKAAIEKEVVALGRLIKRSFSTA